MHLLTSLKSRSGSPACVDKRRFAAISSLALVKMADNLGAAASSAVYEPRFAGMESCPSCTGWPSSQRRVLFYQGRLVGIRDRSGTRICVGITSKYFESNTGVEEMLIAFLSRFQTLPFCQCQNPAEFALQDVLLR